MLYVMADERFIKGDSITLTVTDLAEKEQCFGRLDNGMAVLVSGMLAVGDRVSATIKKLDSATLRRLRPRFLSHRSTGWCRNAPGSGSAVAAS